MNIQVLQKKVMEKGTPKENFLPKEKTIRAAAINRKWRHFIDNSTLHGMQYVFNGQTKIRSIVWAVFFVMSTAYFLFQSSLLLKRYYSYDVTTKVTLQYEKSPEFPAVTICHFDMLRESFVIKYKAEEVFKYALRFSVRTSIDHNDINWKELGNTRMEDMYEIGGHQIKKMMKTCLWSGEICDDRNFTKILTPMGLCHTFNSGKFLNSLFFR